MAGNDARKWAFVAAIRVSNVTSPDDDILPMISPDLQDNSGQSVGLRNGPFCKLITAEGCLNYG